MNQTTLSEMYSSRAVYCYIIRGTLTLTFGVDYINSENSPMKVKRKQINRPAIDERQSDEINVIMKT